MNRIAICALGVAALGALPARIARADGVYVTITGATQGKFRGPSQYGGRLLALSYDEATVSARDPQTGLPTGVVISGMYHVSAEWSAAMPQMMKAITVNEVLSEVKFEFFRQNGGRDEVYYVITLTNARADSLIADYQPGNTAGLPAAVFSFAVYSNHVSYVDPAAPPTQAAGAAATAARANVAMVPRHAAPVITPALYRQMARARTSTAEAGTVNDAWMTVTPATGTFHAEAADHPATTAQVKAFTFTMYEPLEPDGSPSAQRIYRPANAHVSADQTTVQGGTSLERIQFTFVSFTSAGVVAGVSATDTWSHP